MSSRRLAERAVGVILLCVAGCADTDVFRLGFFQASGGNGADRVVFGSLEAVSQSTEASLRELGFVTERTQEEDAVRIAASTRSGARFALVLTRVKNEQGERTRVRLEWQDKPDEQTGARVLARLDAESRK